MSYHTINNTDKGINNYENTKNIIIMNIILIRITSCAYINMV